MPPRNSVNSCPQAWADYPDSSAMRSPVVRVIAALLIAIAVLFYLFHGSVASMQPRPEIHSTLTPKP
jgi:hypothetical protein